MVWIIWYGGTSQRVELVNCFIGAENSVLLQSARTEITDPTNPSLEVNVCVFLDSCSNVLIFQRA